MVSHLENYTDLKSLQTSNEDLSRDSYMLNEACVPVRLGGTGTTGGEDSLDMLGCNKFEAGKMASIEEMQCLLYEQARFTRLTGSSFQFSFYSTRAVVPLTERHERIVNISTMNSVAALYGSTYKCSRQIRTSTVCRYKRLQRSVKHMRSSTAAHKHRETAFSPNPKNPCPPSARDPVNPSQSG